GQARFFQPIVLDWNSEQSTKSIKLPSASDLAQRDRPMSPARPACPRHEWFAAVSQEPPMRRKIPPTQALVCFESAARHESFTKAAEELALTQSAVCRQIANLESF